MSIGKEAVRRGEEATIWDLHQGGCRVTSLMGDFSGHYRGSLGIHCAWSPDGTWVAAGPQAYGATHVWNTTTFQRLHLGTTWEGGLLAVSSDGHWVVTAWDGAKTISRSGVPLSVAGNCWVWNADSGKLHRSLLGHTYWVMAAAFNRRSTRIITGSKDSTIRIWDVESGEQVLVLQEPMKWWITAVACSEDGRMVLSWSYSHLREHPASEEETTVWDASSGTLLASLSRLHGDNTEAQSGPGYTACFSPCGSYLASASKTSLGKVLLWRTSDWSCIGEMWAGGESAVTHIAISPDGKVLCCGTKAGTVFFGCMQDLVSANQD